MIYRDVARKLTALGCLEMLRKKGGSHRKWHNPATGLSTVIPDWKGRDLKIGTLKGVVKQLGLDWSSFESA